MTRYEFVVESNRIEGILRPPKQAELDAHERLWALDALGLAELVEFVRIVAGALLRDRPGMNVIVGSHLPPRGGPGIAESLDSLLGAINHGGVLSPFEAHVRYETLHPFLDGNGRSGRAVWAWQMLRHGRDPFTLGFLHRWYYDSLSEARRAPSTPEEMT